MNAVHLADTAARAEFDAGTATYVHKNALAAAAAAAHNAQSDGASSNGFELVGVVPRAHVVAADDHGNHAAARLVNCDLIYN